MQIEFLERNEKGERSEYYIERGVRIEYLFGQKYTECDDCDRTEDMENTPIERQLESEMSIAVFPIGTCECAVVGSPAPHGPPSNLYSERIQPVRQRDEEVIDAGFRSTLHAVQYS